MDIVLIHPDGLRAVWEEVRAGLSEMPPSDWIAEDVYHAIKSGESALYIAINNEGFSGFMVLRRMQTEFSRKPYLHVWLAYHKTGADMYEAGIQAIRNAAQNMGAHKITFGSPRKGWAKRYPLAEATYEIPA